MDILKTLTGGYKMQKVLLLLVLFCCAGGASAQTNYYNSALVPLAKAVDSAGNRQGETTTGFDRSNYFMLGVASVYQRYPSHFNLDMLSEQGFMIGSSHNQTNIDEINFGNQLQISFNIGNQSFIGYASTSAHTTYPDKSVDTVHYYTAFVSLYSYNVNAEMGLRLPISNDVNRRIIGGLAVTFLNLGGNFTYMSGGRFNDKFLGSIDFVPFYVQVYAKLALKNATFGIGFFSNPYSFAEYRFGPSDFVGNDAGLYLNSAQYTKYMMQFYIYFK